MERRKTQAMASHSAIFLLLSIFTFVFLGSEYLYVNMVSRIVEESQTVIAQNYALGVNALGFLIYPLINRSVRERNKTILIFSLSFLSICARIVIAVALHQIDYAPDTKPGSKCYNKGLQNVYCAIEKCHK